MDQSSILHSQRVGGAVVIVLVLLAAFLFAETLKAFKEYRFVGGGVPVSNVITVSGEGEAYGKPDVATVTFSVVEEGAAVQDIQARATERANAAKAFLKERGIEEKDIKTVDYQITPRYSYAECVRIPCPPQTPRIDGYTVSETVTVKLRNIEAAGDVVAGIGALGVQNISGLSFAVDNPDAITAQARAAAIEDAKAKANELAKDLGVSLVRIVNFSEGGMGYPMPLYAKGGIAMDMAVAESAPSPNLSPGESKVVSNVSITYEIR